MNRRGFVEGIILIALGLVLLANTTGYLGWEIWLEVSRAWPVILVVIGILVLLRRRVPGVLIFLLVALIGINAMRFPLSIAGGLPWDWHVRPFRDGRYPLESGTAHLEQALEPGIDAADISVDLGAGNIEIRGGATGLIEGDLDYIGEAPKLQYRRSGSRAAVSVGGGLSGRRSGDAPPRWLLKFNDSIPVSLSIDAGAGRADLDFSTVKLTGLDMDMGAGQFRVTFGDHGIRTDVSIDTGASDITLVVPASAGVRVKVSGAATGGNLEASGLTRSNGYWVSSNFGTAKSVIEVRVSSAVSRVNIERR